VLSPAPPSPPDVIISISSNSNMVTSTLGLLVFSVAAHDSDIHS